VQRSQSILTFISATTQQGYPMNTKKIAVAVIIAIIVGAFFYFDLNQYVSLNALDIFKEKVQESLLTASLLFFIIYFCVAAMGLPGAGAMTLIAGAVFGLGWGFLLVSFASTLGATTNMLVARFLLRDTMANKFRKTLKKVNDGIEREGSFYLFTIRLIPFIPFFVVNPVFGLTKMPAVKFYIISQLGMIPGTLLFVNAGAAVGSLESVTFSSVFTGPIIASIVLLIAVPWIIKTLLNMYKQHRATKAYKKPQSYDTNMVVIGAGSGGLVAAYIAAAVKAKVTLIEKSDMGGDCLNTGCVPSKALIKAAKTVKQIKAGEKMGVNTSGVNVDFAKVMGHVKGAITDIEPHDSVERYTSLGVDCIKGEAEVISPYEVRVGDQTITTKNIVLATGAEPFIPPIKGLDQVDYLSTDTVWSLTELPKQFLVIGGGPIGCEMAQAFNRLGAKVTVVQGSGQLLDKEDDDVSQFVLEKFQSENVNVLLNTTLKAFVKNAQGRVVASVEEHGKTREIAFDKVLFAVGRKPRVKGFGFDKLDLALNERGGLITDEFLRTSIPNVFAVGDLIGPYQFTHAASHQAWYASVNALFGKFKRFKVDYSVMPWVTFVDPEVARVGASEKELIEQEIEYEVTTYNMSESDRAIAEGETEGFIKVLTEKNKDTVLGAVIVGSHAGELITEFVTAMKQNLGLNKMLGTIHSYPTWSEANKAVAGNWKKAHQPTKVLGWVKKYHGWNRG